MPAIPADFTASKSAVIPSAATFPPKKKKYVSGRFTLSGVRNAVSGAVADAHSAERARAITESCFTSYRPQQTRSYARLSSLATFASVSAQWPTPIAQWWAGPAALHASMNAFAPMEKR